jgi:hypothetical protein
LLDVLFITFSVPWASLLPECGDHSDTDADDLDAKSLNVTSDVRDLVSHIWTSKTVSRAPNVITVLKIISEITGKFIRYIKFAVNNIYTNFYGIHHTYWSVQQCIYR